MTETAPVTGDPVLANKAFAVQRLRIAELERQNREYQRKIDEQDAGDPVTLAFKRQIRDLEKRIDDLSLQGVSNEEVEIVIAEFPWIESIPNKANRIQAVKDIIARNQRAGTNAGDPQNAGRSKLEAAAQAHLTGGGPSAGGTSSSSDYEQDFAKFQKASREAKTQAERDTLIDAWSVKYPSDRPI